MSNHFPHFRDREGRDETTCLRPLSEQVAVPEICTPELMVEPMRLAFLCRTKKTVMMGLLVYKATHGHQASLPLRPCSFLI